MYICAIVVAAGKSERLRSKVSKPLVCLGSKQVLFYSLKTFSECPDVRQVIVVANRSNRASIRRLISLWRMPKIAGVVEGGERRQDSVANGLNSLAPQCSHVLIHDSARPFVDKPSLKRLISAVSKTGAAILGVPVKSTIKEARVTSGRSMPAVRQTLDRRLLWEIQTPQAFRKDILLKAYNSFGMINVTDDSALVEKLGIPVSLVMGSYANIKITTPEDLHAAAALLKKR